MKKNIFRRAAAACLGRRLRRLAVLVLFPLVLPACRQAPLLQNTATWNYADLRAVDAADAAEAGHDLIAIYSRARGREGQVRLDLLDLAAQVDYDLYLAVDSGPGGTTHLPLEAAASTAWDTLIVILASGEIQAFAAGDLSAPLESLALSVLRDPLLDTIAIRFNRLVLPNPKLPYQIEVFITPAGSAAPADRIGPVRSDAPPPARAPVLLAFWNTMPAYTPALALRRWDGAHTGPLGGRHGLYNLLKASRRTGTPLVLLDLNTPFALSALDFVEGLELVQDMAGRELLTLAHALPGLSGGLPSASPAPPPGPVSEPEDVPAAGGLQLAIKLSPWALEQALLDSQETAVRFGLPSQPFLFAPEGVDQVEGLAPGAAKILFVPILEEQRSTSLEGPGIGQAPAPHPLYRYRQALVVPIPGFGAPGQIVQQASLDGPTLEVRRALVETALAAGGSQTPILVLGGSLPETAWGNPQIARAAFQYLAAHPWVQVVNAAQLAGAYPPLPDSGEPAGPAAPGRENDLLRGLPSPLSNPAAASAWQAYQSLFAPLAPAAPELPALRQAYLAPLGMLAAAAQWAEHGAPPPPEQISTACDTDLDADGQPECVLSAERFFGVFDSNGGGLTFAFIRDEVGSVHQIIAPSYQFITGASDPSTWEINQGAAADPSGIRGAFSTPATQFRVQSLANGLVFKAGNGSLVKTYELLENKLRIRCEGSSPHLVQIPFALDPWLRFSPDWADEYHLESRAGAQGESLHFTAGQFKVELTASAAWAAHAFTGSLRFRSIPEDPNRDYPSGHYLPFPMALVEINSPGDLMVEISWEQDARSPGYGTGRP